MLDALYYLKLAVAWLTGWFVAWWLWGAVGLVGAIAVFFLLPALVPSSVRSFLAMSVLSLGVCIAAYSKGNEDGMLLQKEITLREIAAEKLRLELGFQQKATEQTTRLIEAETAKGRLEGQVNDLLQDLAQDTTAVDNECISAAAVERMRKWTVRRRSAR